MHERRMLVEIAEGKSTLGRPKCRWEGDIKIYLKGIFGEDVEWRFLAQYRNNWLALENAMTNRRVP